MKIKISLYDFVWGRNSAYITALYCSYIRRIPRLGYLGIDHKFRLQGEVGVGSQNCFLLTLKAAGFLVS